MHIVTLEEHIVFPEFVREIAGAGQLSAISRMEEQLADITDARLASMNANGIDIQVLSVVGKGAELLPPGKDQAFAARYNDAVASRIAPYPDRFKAFAHLPMASPQAAAEELERTHAEHGFCGALINGLTNDRFLDHPSFAPLLERAEQLQLPLYLHPGLPPEAVAKAYYSDLPGSAGMVLSSFGWGWHAETALHVLRLVFSGTLDRYPGLKIIIGHMGEMIPMMMARTEIAGKSIGLQRPVSQTLREQVHITTSGIFTLPPLMAALATFGIDNVLFSVDYPFSTNEAGKSFLENIPLPAEQLARIAGGNAAQLLGLTTAR
ncbi:amidohydrolase family protein [Chitinophaga varians]|uniref:amidohydrolase family protein n=1 Tax=Chitinophaga varians TaxID=2202339 RepID=UPI00165F3E0E|nr:amidohydrolase family protein [Chitinophaga varians]MBC9914688.1 amidohydrolase [Chitinophaga varians]